MAMQELNTKEEELEGFNNELLNAIEYARDLRKTSISLNDLKTSDASIKYIEGLIARQKEVVEKARQKVAVEEGKLFEMMKERKTYEQLKEKEFEEYKLMMNAKEMIEIDELTSYSYGKNNS